MTQTLCIRIKSAPGKKAHWPTAPKTFFFQCDTKGTWQNSPKQSTEQAVLSHKLINTILIQPRDSKPGNDLHKIGCIFLHVTESQCDKSTASQIQTRRTNQGYKKNKKKTQLKKPCGGQVKEIETKEKDFKESPIASTDLTKRVFETYPPVKEACLSQTSATSSQPHGASVMPYQYHLFSVALLSALLRSLMSKAASHLAINSNSPWQM